MNTIKDLVLAIPGRELLLELAAAAEVPSKDFNTMTVLEFQRRIGLARDAACERDTVTRLPAAEETSDAFLDRGWQ